jgi:hypothetical protein
MPEIAEKLQPGKPYWTGSLSQGILRGLLCAVDLLVKVGCFVKKVNIFINTKKSWSKLASIRRSSPFVRLPWLSTVDLLFLPSLDHLLVILQTSFTFSQTSNLYKEVNRTQPSLTVGVPCFTPEDKSRAGFLTLEGSMCLLRIYICCLAKLSILKLKAPASSSLSLY